MSQPLESLFEGKPKEVDIMLFTKHLAIMVKSGIPITDALITLLNQTKSSAFKRILIEVKDDVLNGQSLAKSFEKHPKTFDKFYVSLIEISEKSGSLDENLDFMSKQLTELHALKEKIRGAMLYPMLVLSMAAVMGGFISLFVLPQLVDFFTSFDVDLPLTTRILLFVANLMKDYGVFIISGIAAAILLFLWLIRTRVLKPYWDTLLIRLPLFGNFVASSQMAQLTRNLGILIKNGVPITESIDITANTINNLKYKNDLLKIGGMLSKGKSIADAMEKGEYWEFPPLVSKMISVGEKTGKLDETLLYLADYYEDEVEEFSKKLTTTLEPILLLVIGLLVGFLALAIITPIYELSGSIG